MLVVADLPLFPDGICFTMVAVAALPYNVMVTQQSDELPSSLLWLAVADTGWKDVSLDSVVVSSSGREIRLWFP